MESGHHSRAQRHGARLAACGGNHLRFWTNLAIHATCVKRMDLPELLQALCGFLQLSLAENGQTHVAVIHSIYRTFWGPVLFSARFSAVMITQRRRHVAPKGRLLHSLPPLPPATISSRHSPLLPGTPHSCTPFLPPPFPFTPATISSHLYSPPRQPSPSSLRPGPGLALTCVNGHRSARPCPESASSCSSASAAAQAQRVMALTPPTPAADKRARRKRHVRQPTA